MHLINLVGIRASIASAPWIVRPDGSYLYKGKVYRRFCDVPVWPNLHAKRCRCGACPK